MSLIVMCRRKAKTLVTLKRGNLPDHVEIKRLVKNQLKLLKKLQQRHLSERENLNNTHVRTPRSFLSCLAISCLSTSLDASHAKA